MLNKEMISKNSKIFVTGHNGLVGNSIVKKLKIAGFKRIITIERKKTRLKRSKECF